MKTPCEMKPTVKDCKNHHVPKFGDGQLPSSGKITVWAKDLDIRGDYPRFNI